MGGTVIWENPHFTAQSTDDTATTRSAL
jgi:hypothetical protein